jgi:cytidylate kinase
VIVTIDGPAGSGKSSTARAVAERLRFRHLDSGAFYRALTLAALTAGVPADRWDRLSADELETFDVRAVPDVDRYRMTIEGRDVTGDIRSPEVTAQVSRMARVPAVRSWLLGRLRSASASGDLVADGRDMGTVVFPEADVKIYLTADLETRARRRLLETTGLPPDPAALDEEIRRIAERDRIDSERDIAPLRPAADATPIDTTRLAFEDQVEGIVAAVLAVRADARDSATTSILRDGASPPRPTPVDAPDGGR